MVNILEEKPDGCIKLLLCNMLGAASVMIAWAALPRGDTGRGQDTRPPLDFRPVLANRDGSAPDHRLIRGNLGLRRTAAVDCRLSYLLRGRSGHCPCASLDHSDRRCADQFSRRPRRPHRQRVFDPSRPSQHATLVFLLSAFAGGLFGFTAMRNPGTLSMSAH